MDPAVFLLITFLAYSILLGVCIASVRGMRRELDGLTRIIELLRMQSDVSAAVPPAVPAADVASLLTPELLASLSGGDQK